MKKLLFCLLTFTFFATLKGQGYGLNLERVTRFKGELAFERQFPYIVLTVVSDPETDEILMCAGALITDSLVFMAAHCFNFGFMFYNITCAAGRVDVYDYVLYKKTGDTTLNIQNIQERTARHVVHHPYYKRGNSRHDLAVLKLEEPFEITPYVQTIQLSTVPLLTGATCTLFSFVDNRNFEFYHLFYKETLEVRPYREMCFNETKAAKYLYFMNCVDTYVCSGKFEGSPVVCNGRLYAYTTGNKYFFQGKCGWSELETLVAIPAKLHYDWVRLVMSGEKNVSPQYEFLLLLLFCVYYVNSFY